MRSVSLSATLFLLFAPSSTAGADLAPSALTVAITVRPASIEGQGHILVDFEFKNPTSSDERLEKWLALEPPEVTIALLRISRADGSPVRYIGEHINRRHIGAASYLRIPARGSRVVKAVDVTGVYDWPQTPENLTIRYEAFTVAHGRLQLLRSSNQSLHYVPHSN